MDERHVPSIGLRYWALFIVTSVFGGHMGDLLTAALPIGVLGRMLVLAGLLAAVFVVERYDRSSTDSWYWIAAIVIQVAAVRLSDLSTIQLGFSPLEVVAALALLLMTTMVVARSDETHLFSTLQLERPGTAAKPMADVAHWLGMIVASTMGSAAEDLLSLSVGAGTVVSTVLFSAMVVGLLLLQRRSRPHRLHAFWLTTILARADGVAIGDLLSKGPHLHVGLGLSTLLSGCVAIGLLLFWRQPKSRPGGH
jgi:uncharacterized membrane-anchored protein